MTSLGGSGFPGSVHNDVLTANPSTEAETTTLMEELKRRGRAAVACKDYGNAELLYSKGIEISSSIPKRDKSILFANRSLCRLQMNKASDAHQDALESTQIDPSYVKSHWRLGQALSALERTDEAKEAMQKALKLEPTNKALKKEIDKLEKKLEDERQLMKDTENMDIDDSAPKPTKKTVTTTTTSKKSTSYSSTSSTNSATVKADVEDDDVFTKSDHVKGYKVVNGKKTSFFHNELSEEAKKLIGDIAPKKLETAPPVQSGPAPDGTSAWNKAGTWEERDVTSWAKDTLKEGLAKAAYELPEGSPDAGARASIAKVKKVDGNAFYATVRGKKRHMYEFAIVVEWQLELSSGNVCKGSMTFPDVDGTCELGDGYDMTKYSVDEAPSDARHLLDRFVKNGGLRDAIHESLDDWVRLFRATY
eukprot:CAMPEP_0118703318 /NCGR_PEP_ID=MMETSP0800-20121206/18473_1 /TAXON_ID=210618 ORGANISM="Striatella unipunctata, Strain CCMP2910" /NCGR_SAMPLE_ID=MMETSP0800 /ASSEMBLY_ACC=CAM_ASM_000638 /LENGTH=419 /DNA_ID=CAMNT_0006604803 /DNA_START=108 /DNA_END=1367 /DNA_ORIENTATION=+